MSAWLRDAIKSLLPLATTDDLLDIIPEIAALLNRSGFEYWWTAKDVYRAFERAGIHVSRDTFYSPLPNTVQVATYLASGNPLRSALQVLDAHAFRSEWAKIRRFKDELGDIPRVGDEGFYWSNIFFPNLDAILYYCLIRQYRPRVVFEIGSGFSTHIAARALRANGLGRLAIVEPYPTPKLCELFGDLAEFYEQRIQDVPLGIFAQLQAKDFLFVDSSHVSKTGSDVNHILFEILPVIPPDVFLHFHDIFLPYEYPVESVVERNWAWNEQYILLALLMGHDALEPIVGSYLLQRQLTHVLEQDLEHLNAGPLSGASLWIKTGRPRDAGRNGKCRRQFDSRLDHDLEGNDFEAFRSVATLRSEPWRAALLPLEAVNCVSMLTCDEKQLLYWLTSEYFSGAGAIIDAGCFVGGSTVALAAGLASAEGRVTWGERAVIHSYDMFLADDYMRAWYFERNKLQTEGNRFRNIFDMNTAPWRDMLRVRDGDITTFAWAGAPIEIVFIDVCKLWHVNDYVTREFFPHLIPGRSLVVQQDFFHHLEYWVILTQELLNEYFEYIGFVKWNSAVFRCVKPVDPGAIPPALRDLGLPELDRLLRLHIARYQDPYQLGMLNCALAFLHLDFDSIEEARRLNAEVNAHYAGEHWVAEALKDLAAELAKRNA